MRVLVAAFVAVLAITCSVALAASSTPDGAVSSFQVSDSRHTYPMSLDGLDVAIRTDTDRRTFLEAAMYAEKARRDAEAEALRRAQERAARPVSRPVTGDCQSMKPPGFPDWIIQRESGGDPNALNPSGAFGCAQLMPGTGGSGTYAERWARTWAGGAGACHWQPPRYCGG